MAKKVAPFERIVNIFICRPTRKNKRLSVAWFKAHTCTRWSWWPYYHQTSRYNFFSFKFHIICSLFTHPVKTRIFSFPQSLHLKWVQVPQHIQISGVRYPNWQFWLTNMVAEVNGSFAPISSEKGENFLKIMFTLQLTRINAQIAEVHRFSRQGVTQLKLLGNTLEILIVFVVSQLWPSKTKS